VAPGNYEMAGQAFLGSDMRASLLMFLDDRGVGQANPMLAGNVGEAK
jgi:hypothetical protein